MAEALGWPGLKVLDSLGGLGAIEASAQVFATDDPEDLDVHQGPRWSSSAISTSARPSGEARRRVRASHVSTLGRAAKRTA